MPYELILAEKPSAAKKIAEALSDSKIIKENNKGVPYYLVSHTTKDGKHKDIVVASAVGHLFGVDEEEKSGWTYPVFNMKWVPTYLSKKGNYAKKYADTLKKLAKGANEFTIATDYDIEGEVIGLNIVRHLFKQKDANRMHFSTLTKNELRKAYENKMPHLDWGQANAGETRHFLDWLYGINLSRALSLSVKRAKNMFKVLSIGRVQGPALKIITDKEKEIQAFEPKPYWQIELTGVVRGAPLIALHAQDKFWEKEDATKAYEHAKGHDAKVAKIETRQFEQKPPTPFDLTSLQTEAYRSLKIQPKDTLAIAQTLYTDGLISYPRTSSQKYPKELGLDKVMREFLKHGTYKKLAEKLLQKPLIPNEGSKSDPAHPAIYPTGQFKQLTGREEKIYDLIVRRFLAVFAEPAKRETMKITLDCNGEEFSSKGTRTVYPGWHEFYGPHVKLEEEELPKVEKGDVVKVEKLELLEKQTQPPKRYTPASIIKELEKRNLGTKATRANIIENLYQRGYVNDKSIEATGLGMRTVATLEKYCPEILDEEMTRKFEEEMEEIRAQKKKEEEVLEEAKTNLSKILDHFKKNEALIGEELAQATIETRDELSHIGKCPSCKSGDLQVRKGKYGQFIACNKYPDCKTTFSIPAKAKVTSMKKECEHCGYPIVSIGTGKRPRVTCLNPDCPGKKNEDEEKQMKKAESNPCPSCGKGQLVIRKSIYGKFVACDQYPKCKYTQKFEEGKTDEHM
ncbi:DNA topoisomerase I [Candidatus Woesearchaeota archaeon]|nr:MAG: DNA topoisomerase I [Candidatus Woesearchaeota archaeon]